MELQSNAANAFDCRFVFSLGISLSKVIGYSSRSVDLRSYIPTSSDMVLFGWDVHGREGVF